jgi:single-stranded DNA-binding protein
LQTRSWTDKQGQQRKTTEVMCERMQLGPRAANTGGGGGQGGGFGKSAGGDGGTASAGPAGVPSLDEIPTINLEDEDIKPEDIPF